MFAVTFFGFTSCEPLLGDQYEKILLKFPTLKLLVFVIYDSAINFLFASMTKRN